MSPKYLVGYPQPSGRGRRFIEAEDLDAYFPERTRDTGRRIAGMVMRESTGKVDRRRLRLMALVPSRWGGMMGVGSAVVVANTAAGVRGGVRGIRPQEAARLEAIDQQIAELRAQRQELLRLAWQRGHYVLVGELREKAERHAQRRNGR